MNTLTIIKEDNAVYIDGVARTVDCSALAFHALQWNASPGYGHIEYPSVTCPGCRGVSKQPNTVISDVVAYQPYIDAWTAAAPAK